MSGAAAYFMPVRAGMGMDAGPVTGKCNAVLIYKAAPYGWKDGGNAECLMEKLFIIKRKCIPGNSAETFRRMAGSRTDRNNWAELHYREPSAYKGELNGDQERNRLLE